MRAGLAPARARGSRRPASRSSARAVGGGDEPMTALLDARRPRPRSRALDGEVAQPAQRIDVMAMDARRRSDRGSAPRRRRPAWWASRARRMASIAADLRRRSARTGRTAATAEELSHSVRRNESDPGRRAGRAGADGERSPGRRPLLLLHEALTVDAVAREGQRVETLVGDRLAAPLAGAEGAIVDLSAARRRRRGGAGDRRCPARRRTLGCRRCSPGRRDP